MTRRAAALAGPALVTIAVLAGVGNVPAVHGAPPSIVSPPVDIPLAIEGPPGALGESRAYGVNDSGVVVGWYRLIGQIRAFRWSAADGAVDLGSGIARRINDAGLIAGHDPYGLVPHAYVWQNGVQTFLTDGRAYDVNDRGLVAGATWASPPNVYSAFLWHETLPIQDLGTLLGFGYFAGFSEALGLNDRGVVVGWSSSAAGFPHAFRWSASTGMVDLGTPGGPYSLATDVNRHGQIVGGGGQGEQTHAASWTVRTQWTLLPDLGGFSLATAINSLGQIAGWAETPEGVRHAVVWLRHGELLDLGPGEAHDVNDAGQVVGWRQTPTGPRAVQWQLAPAARGRAVGLTR